MVVRAAMKQVALAYVLVLISLTGCTVARQAPRDSGPQPRDGGGDAFFAPRDAYVPAVDAYVPVVDAHVSRADAHAPRTDAYVPLLDAYVRSVDAAAPPRDTGVPPSDSGLGVVRCVDAACVGRVLISEMSTRGPVSALDEFVEVENAGASPLDLSGVDLYYLSAGGAATRHATVQAGVTLAPGGFALFASTDFAAATPDVSERWTNGMADNGGTLELRVGALVIDRFAWGTATVSDAAPFAPVITTAALTAGASYERKASAMSTTASMGHGGADELVGNRYDSDHDATDFVMRAVRQPQTLTSTPE